MNAQSIKDKAESHGLPDVEVEEFHDPARGVDIVRIICRRNGMKHGGEVIQGPNIPNKMFDLEVEKMFQRIRESLVHHSAAVEYKHSNYFMEWERRDYYELECAYCGESQCMRKPDSKKSPHKDVVMMYLLRKIDCICQIETLK